MFEINKQTNKYIYIYMQATKYIGPELDVALQVEVRRVVLLFVFVSLLSLSLSLYIYIYIYIYKYVYMGEKRTA